MATPITSNTNRNAAGESTSAADSNNCGQTDIEEQRSTDTFLSSVILLMMITVVQKAIGFVRAIIVCRMLPAQQMGDWGLMQSVILTALPLVLLSIPACFGRYCEFYGKRKQLRSFLFQSSAICLGLLVFGEIVLLVFQRPIAAATFGSPDRSWAVVGCAIAIVPFALFSYGTELLNALRKSRVTSIANFINGLVLTIVAIGLLKFYKADATSMLIAFSAAASVAVLWAALRLWSAVKEIPEDQQALPFLKSWKILLPIVGLFWLNDFLVNMFYMSDRFMLINLLDGDIDHKRFLVGNYEAGHMVPLLFSAILLLVAKILMPYLAKAWEAGDHQSVVTQTNLSVKISVWLMTLCGLLLVQLSHPIFEILFKGKYPAGDDVFALVIMFYIGTGVSALVMNYFWCAGKAQWSVAALAFGVISNIVGNLLLVPYYGIYGAAVATLVGAFGQVILQLVIANRLGLNFDKGVLLVTLASLLILMAPSLWPVTVPLAFVSLFVPGVLNNDDRKILAAAKDKVFNKLGLGN